MNIFQKIKKTVKDMSPKNIFRLTCAICFIFMVAGIINLHNAVSSLMPQEEVKVEPTTVNYTEFMKKVAAHELTKATILADRIEATEKSGTEIVLYHGRILSEPTLPKVMDEAGVDVSFPKEDEPGIRDYIGIIFAVLFPLSMMVFFVAAGTLLYPQIKEKFSASWMRVVPKTGVKFKDVAGQDAGKEELEEIVTFFKNPEKYSDTGARVPCGVLMIGPAGTGKTLLAEAVAGEAGVPFLACTGSDFSNKFVGVGRDRVEAMFKKARKFKKCIIFIDEFDSVARVRGASNSDVGREQDTTLNQLLTEMSGFGKRGNVVVIAASNRLDVLDPAAIRPGRFDRHVLIGLPDIKDREAILKVHTENKIPLDKDVDLNVVARGTPGFSGAELEMLCNEAAVLSSRRDSKLVSAADFESARDKVLMGLESKNKTTDQGERKLTAYHEAGHALLACANPHSDPVHQTTIMQRGTALGMMMRLPEKEKLSVTLAQLKADLDVVMAGRAAEEIVFGKEFITSGAMSDIEQATDIATNMVVNWGMSEAIGMRKIAQSPLGYGEVVDREIKAVLDGAYLRAIETLNAQRPALDAIAEALLERETLSGKEVRTIYKARVEPLAA